MTTTSRRRLAVDKPKPNLVTFDLAHWVKHLDAIATELRDGGCDDYVYDEFAYDLFLTLGFGAYDQLVKRLGELSGAAVGTLSSAYFDDEGRCFARRTWGTHGDEDALVDIYRVLGWEQSILFGHWQSAPEMWEALTAFDHDGTIPPRFEWCATRDCPIHPSGPHDRVEIVERAHGPYCPDRRADLSRPPDVVDETVLAAKAASLHSRKPRRQEALW